MTKAADPIPTNEHYLSDVLDTSEGTRFAVDTPEGLKHYDIYSREGFRILTNLWTRAGWERKFSYDLTWLGIPVIQMPEDLLIMQELIHKVRPDRIIETGTAHGGTAVFYASLLDLLGRGRVISIDNEVRKYNHLAINAHPMSKRISIVEGDSTEKATLAKVRSLVPKNAKTLVCLDSNHTLEHVLREMALYHPFVSPDSYMVVFDGIMESVADAPNGRPEWDTDNPKEAVRQFLASNPDFEEDPYYNRLGATYAPKGFVRRHKTED